jgi:hypothetical protein
MNKRPNVRFHVVEGAEIQTKSIEIIFSYNSMQL